MLDEQLICFDLIHVDGNHDTERVMEDLDLYLPRFNPRGFIALDDFSCDSVKTIYMISPLFGMIILQSKYFSTKLKWCNIFPNNMISMSKNNIKNTCSKFKSTLNVIISKFNGVHGRVEHDVVILDDMFPHLLSAFRITEFNALLQHFKNAAVYSNGITFRTIGDSRDFKEVYAEYADLYPDLSSRVLFFNVKTKVSARLCYVMFLNNAILFIDYIERCKLPFVVELYPGGGFQLYNQDSDQKLRRILSSPLFKKIIVTQKISYDYLLDNYFCRADQIEMIYGGVFPQEQLLRVEMPRLLYPVSKKTFSICFVAHKYMPQGRDKGYDIFIETARILAERHPEIYFHVVGPYGPEDLPVSDLGVRIKFHGSCTTDFFPDFYSKMDLILSPNIPFILAPGAFDGFPTGACMEAGMCGTAVFCCDELKLNPFVNGEEIVIIPRNHFEISSIISEYVRSPDKLHQVAQKGQQRFKKVFSLKDQMDPRISVLEECMQTKG